jgi:hypothetical protein
MPSYRIPLAYYKKAGKRRIIKVNSQNSFCLKSIKYREVKKKKYYKQELREALSVFLRPQKCFTFKFISAVKRVDNAAASAVKAYSIS